MFYKESYIVKEVFTPTIRLRLLKNSIVHYTYLPDVDLGLNEAIFNHDTYMEFKTGIHPLLIDTMGGFVTPTKEYTDYIKSKESETPLVGRAVVTDSLAINIVLSVYYRVKDTMYPIKIFKSYDEAQAWLLALSIDKERNKT